MYLEAHQQRSRQQMHNEPHTLVHIFLDQFFDQYKLKYPKNPGLHRLVLHHEEGISLVTALFGKEAAKAARQHIMDDLKSSPEVKSLPQSVQAYPQWLALPSPVQKMILANWRQMKKLHHHFYLVVLGTTNGSLREPLKRILQEADLVIITGKYWDAQNKNQTREQALADLQKNCVVIALHDHPDVDGIWLRNRYIYFEVEKGGASGINICNPNNTDGSWIECLGDDVLCLRPGACGLDPRRGLSLIGVDSRGGGQADKGKDLTISLLVWEDELADWVQTASHSG